MKKDSFTWTVGGEAGFGINASGLIFSKTLTRQGFYIFDYIEYPSLIRGGHNVYYIHAGQKEVFSQEKGIDILVALNRETFDLHKESLKREPFVIYDQDQFKINKKEIDRKKINLLHVPLAKLVEQVGGIKLMQNNVALGASVALLGLGLQPLLSVIKDIFERKGPKIVSENQKSAQVGYDYVRKNYKSKVVQTTLPKEKKEKLVVTGNEAISLGAVLGGCQFYAAYPMTPASSILHHLAGWAKKTGMVVKHAEDEISVINYALGASFAGVRSAVATSGGGFALMQESVSLAGITETPLVIIECQRTGPASGMPTWTEQADLQFVLRSGHGDFPKIVLAPGDPEEAFCLTAQAFNLADIYQCPVFILSDKYLSESHKSIDATCYRLPQHQSKARCGAWHATRYKINRGKLLTKDKRQKTKDNYESYKRYKAASDGISARILPGTKGYFYQANSYEHSEDGHTTENIEERIKQVDKRARKMKTFVKKHLPEPKVYGSRNAKVTLIGWGSTKMPVLQTILGRHATLNQNTAVPELSSVHGKEFDSGQARDTRHVNYLHLNYLWPFPKKAVAKVLNQAKKTLLLEGNSTAQLGQLIKQETGIEIKNKYLKYDGRPFYPKEILMKIKDL